MKKILINTFALIGFVTFILLACSVDDIDSSDNNNNNSETVSNNYGKYQVASTGYTNRIVVLNTETGVMVTYYSGNTSSGSWSASTSAVTFTH
tara:strand:+ start:370 stop:648 length:279 start_codon:yes stop_codon:yes gene_type:complete